MLHWLAKKYLAWRGWTLVGEAPPFDKFVAIAAPHTTNWDFVLFLAVVSHFQIPARAIGKASLVRWPFGRLMRRLGIIPVQRDTGQGLVDTMVEEYADSQRMALVVAPEGTRRAAAYWRAGFYRIAMAAGVPIVFAFMDYEHKRAGVGPTLHPTGDISADMDVVRAFYEGINGKYPANQGPVVLREETDAR